VHKRRRLERAPPLFSLLFAAKKQPGSRICRGRLDIQSTSKASRISEILKAHIFSRQNSREGGKEPVIDPYQPVDPLHSSDR